jgi:hypothetical protein
MTDPTVPGFNPGGIEDRVDTRDHKWTEVGFGSAPFDWSVGYDVQEEVANAIGITGFKIPVKDQNGSGSCGGQAWSYYAEVLEAVSSKTFEERSAKFIYAQTYVPGGGSYGRDNCEIFVKQGVAREETLPSYENGNPPSELFMTRSQDILASTRQDAKLSMALSYANVDSIIDQVAQAIRDNKGVVLGVRGQNNGTWVSPYPVPPTSFEWGHWVYAGKAKMINGVKHIGFLNSWGIGVGDLGWQWLSEDWFKTNIGGALAIFSVWTQVFNSVPVPPTFHHVFSVNMKLGDKGPEVVALQKVLQIEGLFPASVPTTGYFGNITQASVAKFQQKNNITPTAGYCGPKTRGKLNEKYGQ